MFSSDSKSKRFAELFLQQLGGTLKACNVSFSGFKTARVMVKLRFDGMDMEAYFFSPFTYILIKNFYLTEDVNFSINASQESLGLHEPVDGAFNQYDAPVYSNSGYSLKGLKRFCLQSSNESDIRQLALLPGESLGISATQITLLSKSNDLDKLKRRLDLISGIFHRNKIKRLKLFQKSAYTIRIGSKIADRARPEAGHVFGGCLDAESLICKNCNRDLDLLLRVDMEEAGLKTKSIKERFLYVLACLKCEHGLPPLFVNYSNKGPRVIEQPEGESFDDYSDSLSERDVQIVPHSKKANTFNGPLHKMGGTPDWIQGEDIPLCCSCSNEMEFMIQLDSDPDRDLQFGDDGRLFAFICRKCKVISTFMQSH
jgi:hypothetical protein